MKAYKVVNTYKDGMLTSSKKLNLEQPKVPKHSKILSRAEAAALALRQALESLEGLSGEAKHLRRELIFSQRETQARLKEREALRGALQSKNDQITSLKERNEDLEANLAALRDDHQHLESELKKYQRAFQGQVHGNAKTVTVIKDPKNSNAKSLELTSENNTLVPSGCDNSPAALLEEEDKTRSIAASPVKK